MRENNTFKNGFECVRVKILIEKITMTKEDFLAGMGETVTQREKREIYEAWEAYKMSDEGFQEILVLMEQGEYDGPTGDA